MEEYRVLLADDEEEIRMGISRKLDWSSQQIGRASCSERVCQYV